MTTTPGPWYFVGGNQIRSDKHQIARIWMMRNGEGVANARLIAAAPKLLNVVRFLLSNPDNRISNADLAAANQVLTEVEGVE